MHDMPPMELKKTWRFALRVWWAMMWRMFVGVCVVMGIVTLYIQYGPYAPTEHQVIQLVQTWVLVVLLPLGIWAVRVVMNKNFKNFRLALVPRVEKPVQNEAAKVADPALSVADVPQQDDAPQPVKGKKAADTSTPEQPVAQGDSPLAAADKSGAQTHEATHSTAVQRKKPNKKRTKTKK